MNIQQLTEAGGFSDTNPIKKEVVWLKKNLETGDTEEVKFDIHIKRQSWGDTEQLWAGDSSQSKTAKLIASSVLLGENKDESFTYEQAMNLDAALATALLGVIKETYAQSKEQAKN